jgi:hypothetical protein
VVGHFIFTFCDVKEYKVLMILMGVSHLCLETTKAIFMEFQQSKFKVLDYLSTIEPKRGRTLKKSFHFIVSLELGHWRSTPLSCSLVHWSELVLGHH